MKKKETEEKKPEKIPLRTFTLEGLLHPLKKEPLQVGMLTAETLSFGSDTKSILASILEGCKRREHHIITAAEYSFFPYSGPLYESEVQAYLGALKEASCWGDILIIPGTFVWQKEGNLFNTCFALYQGEVIHQHHKMSDGGEVRIAGHYGLTANFGTTKGLFDWEGLKLGIEICAESGLLGKFGIRNRDLLILTSCGLPASYFLKESMEAVRDFGYGIMVDGGHPVLCSAIKKQPP